MLLICLLMTLSLRYNYSVSCLFLLYLTWIQRQSTHNHTLNMHYKNNRSEHTFLTAYPDLCIAPVQLDSIDNILANITKINILLDWIVLHCVRAMNIQRWWDVHSADLPADGVNLKDSFEVIVSNQEEIILHWSCGQILKMLLNVQA